MRRPLAEGAVLKKRFDDIFAATKYTKALEAIRKLKTDQAQDIRLKRLSLDNLKTLKDQAHKLRLDLGAAESAREKHLEELTALAAEDKQKMAELEKYQATLARLQALDSQLSVLKAKRDTVVAETKRRKDALSTVIENSTLEDLLQLQQTAEERANKDRADLAAFDHDMSGVLAEQRHLADHLNRELAKQNRLNAEMDVQNKRIAERKATAAALAQRHPEIGVRFINEPTAEEVQAFEHKVCRIHHLRY